MQFVVGGSSPTSPSELPEGTIQLTHDSWDDYGFKSLYSARIVASKRWVDIGPVKIISLDLESGAPALPKKFSRLPQRFCSLGQDPEYYSNIRSLTDRWREYLRSVRDAAYDERIERMFREAPGWRTSLLRFGQAEHALRTGRDLASGRRQVEGISSFTFQGMRDLTIGFNFDDSAELPGRCNVIVGYNGAGKTRLLGDIAVAASRVGIGDEGLSKTTLSGRDTTFGSVIAISYSAFDNFALPSMPDLHQAEADNEIFGYVYCGLRRVTAAHATRGRVATRLGEDAKTQLKSIDEVEREFAAAIRTAASRKTRKLHLRAALDALSAEPSFGRIGVDPSRFALPETAREFNVLSTGHKIVLNIVAQLGAHLRERSLVLIDEPESHLHPPLMAALLKSVHSLLDAYDSFAVIATHSPVVLQEIPARYVRILERFGDTTTVQAPEVETFAESIGAITRYVFSLDSSASDYQGVIKALAQRYSLDEVEELFDNGLSAQGRALLLNYLRRAGQRGN